MVNVYFISTIILCSVTACIQVAILIDMTKKEKKIKEKWEDRL